MDTFWSDVFKNMKETVPNLRLDLRAKGLPNSIIDDGINQGLKIRVTTKYWMEQMGMPFHPTHINRQNQHDRRHGYADLLSYPQRYKMHWRSWTGGTVRVLLWGSPEYMYAGLQKALTCTMAIVMRLMNLLQPRCTTNRTMLSHLIY